MLVSDFETLLESAKKIAVEISGVHAADVDHRARFPQESVDAMKEAGLMSALVPQHLGGAGLGLLQLGQICAALSAQCSATGMVLAMHYSQLACLSRHCQGHPEVEAYLRELVKHQYLLASMTSEQGTFGATRTSICAVHVEGGTYMLAKDATTGSYCAQADAIVITCRRHADAPASDQVLVLAQKGQYTLEQTSQWDTLGMRGTCSPGFKIQASGPAWQVLPGAFADSSAESMVPVSHVLWAALWTGIAHGALQRAGLAVRAAARKTPGQVPHTARMLANAVADLQAARQMWQMVAQEFDALGDARADLHAMNWALKFNSLKIKAAEAAPRLVHQALQIVGIQGYKNDGPHAVGRHYRDVLSASLMISNERIQSTSADMLLVLKDF
jgi:acyl-CoA dehydrogenase